ncbi:MAG: hypothetical protein ACF8OB_15515 [Phycisphaeraceae bacterium JB051]
MKDATQSQGLAFIRYAPLLIVMISLVGCELFPTTNRNTAVPAAYQRPPMIMPSYAKLVDGHNSHIQGLTRVWAKANIDVTYRDDEGKTKKESGDQSTLMIDLPQNVALSLGKFGLGTLLWAGCDDEHFWFFDLIGEKSMLYGSHSSLSHVNIRNLPLQIRPADIPMLLGLLPLNPNGQAKVDWERGYFTIEPADANVKILIDPVSYAVRQVIIFAPDGQPAVVSTLNQLYGLPLAGSDAKAYLHLAVRIDVPSEGFSMNAKLSQVTDAKPGVDRAKDKAFARGFDWHYLADRAFKIPLDKRIDIDQEMRR